MNGLFFATCTKDFKAVLSKFVGVRCADALCEFNARDLEGRHGVHAQFRLN